MWVTTLVLYYSLLPLDLWFNQETIYVSLQNGEKKEKVSFIATTIYKMTHVSDTPNTSTSQSQRKQLETDEGNRKNQ